MGLRLFNLCADVLVKELIKRCGVKIVECTVIFVFLKLNKEVRKGIHTRT